MSAGVYVCELEPGDVTPMGKVADVERVTDQHTTVTFEDGIVYRYGKATTVVTVLNDCEWVGQSPDGETRCPNAAEGEKFCPRHAAVARSYEFAEAVINR